jgi:hypothetical protein
MESAKFTDRMIRWSNIPMYFGVQVITAGELLRLNQIQPDEEAEFSLSRIVTGKTVARPSKVRSC